MKSPFKFLDAFDLSDKDYFFGREKEVAELYKMVNQNRLILVYGQSGTGKTSLVQCGLASQFESVDWYQIFVRRGEDINESLDDALRKALKDELYDTYVETVEEIYAQYVRPVYLLFDQFEELFILGTPEERLKFFTTIESLVEARLPCRIIFIMREEYLAHLYEFEKVIPTLLDRRLRVEPMSFKNVASVIQRSFESFNVSLDNPESNTEEIVEKLRAGSGEIQLPYLQVYMDMLYREDYKRTYPSGPPDNERFPPLRITSNEIQAFGEIGNVLEKFLDEQTASLQAHLSVKYPNISQNCVIRILDLFVTEEGTKKPIPYTREEETIHLPENITKVVSDIGVPVLSESLHELENFRILRITDDTIELSHDTLAKLIDKNRSDEQRHLNTILRQIRSAYEASRETQEFLTRKQLAAYEPYLSKLNMDWELANFVNGSKEYVESQQKAEIERQEREKALEREKQEQLAATKRQRIISLIVGTALIVTTVSTIYALIQTNQLKKNQELLEAARQEAENNTVLAQQARRDLIEANAINEADKVEDIIERAIKTRRTGSYE